MLVHTKSEKYCMQNYWMLKETDGKETNIGYMKKLKSKEKNQSKKLNN